MEDSKDLMVKIKEELRGLTSSITGAVQSLRKMQEPIAESGKRVPEATMQLEKITEPTEEAAHQMIDKVESISRVSEEVVQEIANLRKALPSTYFKNRSKIRDTVNRIEEKAQRNLDDVFAIVNALQSQAVTAQNVQYALSMMEKTEQRLYNLQAICDGKEGVEKLQGAIK
jgi:chemotaxis regulatin CheY-phosphate phosphatase CheZ